MMIRFGNETCFGLREYRGVIGCEALVYWSLWIQEREKNEGKKNG